MPKITLELEEAYPYIIFGISASASDYRLCWALNRALELDLKRQDALLVYSRSKEKSEHAFFTYLDPQLHLCYRLVSNRQGSSRFLPEAAQADYLFIVDESQAIDEQQLLSKVKALRPVLMAFQIHTEGLRHKQNLLLTT